MTDRERVERARVGTDEMRLEFIKTELELGSTLLELAQTELSWESKEAADEVLAKAEKACWEAGEQMAKAKLRNQDISALEGDLQSLQDGLDALHARIERAKRKRDTDA